MPLQVIETTDTLTEMIQFQTSAVYETIISLQTLLQPGRNTEWASSMQVGLPSEFWEELAVVYKLFNNGTIFFELAEDYPDHDDVPGFTDYVRVMAPEDFVFYVLGRILSREQIAEIGLDARELLAELEKRPEYWHPCDETQLDQILLNLPAFQHRLADLWQWYWEDFLKAQIADIRPHWESALNDKTSILALAGGQSLLEHVAGKTELPPPLPPDIPVTEVVFIPLYLIPKRTYMFFGYGKVTILFDSEMTESRLAEIERSKEQALEAFKALGDGSRLEILRLIAHAEGIINGKKIAQKLNLSASAVSRHLTQLRDAGLILEASQDNRTITYRLQKDTLTTLPEKLIDYLYH